MKSIAYAVKEQDDFNLYLFDDQKEVTSSDSFSALMMQRLDFSVIVTEVPPVPPNEMENLLLYKLRSLYPGDPETTIFDFKLITKNKQRYAVIFITSRETIDKYKEKAGMKPLLLPFSIMNKLAKKYENENCIIYFWHKNWIDISIFEAGLFKSSFAIKREKEVFLDILKIRNMVPREYAEYRNISVGFRDEISFLQEQTHDFFKSAKELQFIPIEETLLLFSQNSDYLFRKKLKSFMFFYRKIRHEMLLLPLVILICLFFNKYIDSRAQYLINLKKTLDARIKIYKKVKEYSQKKETLNKYFMQKPADVFLLLSEIEKIFKEETKIRSFEYSTKDKIVSDESGGKRKRIKVYHFIIKGVTRAETLQYIEVFNKNPYFSEVSIPNVSGNEFHLEGTFVKGADENDK